MRRFLTCLLLASSLSAAFPADAPAGRVIKVLPLFLDLKGREALSPSLFDRDAYQAYLRQHPEQRSAIRFDVLWKASNTGSAPLNLYVELRGLQGGIPCQTTLKKEVTPGFFRRWTSFTLGGTDYKNIGEVTAWRATLWSGNQLLGEQKSFLW
jgi:hypothetical protein